MFLQIKQAAKLLDVSRQWVHELINRGEIATGEVAGRRFVLQDDRFEALRRARETAPSCSAIQAPSPAPLTPSLDILETIAKQSRVPRYPPGASDA